MYRIVLLMLIILWSCEENKNEQKINKMIETAFTSYYSSPSMNERPLDSLYHKLKNIGVLVGKQYSPRTSRNVIQLLGTLEQNKDLEVFLINNTNYSEIEFERESALNLVRYKNTEDKIYIENILNSYKNMFQSNHFDSITVYSYYILKSYIDSKEEINNEIDSLYLEYGVSNEFKNYIKKEVVEFKNNYLFEKDDPFFVHIYENKLSYYHLTSDSLIIEKKNFKTGEKFDIALKLNFSEKSKLKRILRTNRIINLSNSYFNKALSHPKSYVFTFNIKGKEKVVQIQQFYVSELGKITDFINMVLKNNKSMVEIYYPKPNEDNRWKESPIDNSKVEFNLKIQH